MSKGEEKIASIFRKEKIEYKREWVFNDLKSTKHELMRYDFAIFDSGGHLIALCEVDGAQHFQRVPKFQKERKDFLKTQSHDRQKNSYALAHSIPLYRVPYWELDKISCVRDIITQSHLVKSKYHNNDLEPPQ